MAKRRKKRKPHSEETKQKMRDAYQRRVEAKKVEKQKQEGNKDIRQNLAEWLGI
jgi:hypothetical protein